MNETIAFALARYLEGDKLTPKQVADLIKFYPTKPHDGEVFRTVRLNCKPSVRLAIQTDRRILSASSLASSSLKAARSFMDDTIPNDTRTKYLATYQLINPNVIANTSDLKEAIKWLGANSTRWGNKYGSPFHVRRIAIEREILIGMNPDDLLMCRLVSSEKV